MVSHMPTYAKFMKEILSKKRKVEETLVVKLTEHCTSINIMTLSSFRKLEGEIVEIRERQYDDPHLVVLKCKVQHGDTRDVTIGDYGVLRMQDRICVPNMDVLYMLILKEAHSLRYFVHPCAAKMYQDLRQHYWWRRMKKDVVGFVARCLNCQQVKYENQRLGCFRG
ncbi:uncharacterized protein [Nicotiana tomentosiformis]|uniref:uncharacterized protein n=1 Tax=Nicotiana tomentosiformis TaxID=4098 RepID=UPI00388C4431